MSELKPRNVVTLTLTDDQLFGLQELVGDAWVGKRPGPECDDLEVIRDQLASVQKDKPAPSTFGKNWDGAIRVITDHLYRLGVVQASDSAKQLLGRMIDEDTLALIRSAKERHEELAEHPASGQKYLRKIQVTDEGQVDVYAVLDAFAVTCPARQHAIKKLLCSGLRGKGCELQDLVEARDAVTRAVQLQKNREEEKES